MILPRITLAYCFCLLILTTSVAQSASAGDLKSNPVFQSNCAKCHGKDATGRFMAGPSLVSAKTTAQSEEQLQTMITNGKGRMPKFEGKLTPQEVSTLVSQIKAAGQK